MKKIYITLLIIVPLFMAVAGVMEESGKAGKTGSPGENNCTGCHTSFPVNSGPGSITITSPNLTNWEYALGQTYQIDVTVTQAGQPRFGFGFEALKTSNNTNGGTLTITNSTVTQLKIATVTGSNRTNVTHKHNQGYGAGTFTFSFDWTAPTTNVGNIKFYAAGNASDDQGDSLGDYIYITNQLVTPLTTGISALSPNELLSIYPNPVHYSIKANVPAATHSIAFNLFDCNGNLVLKKEIENVKANSKVEISLPAEIANGIYFLKGLSADNKFYTAKVLVYN